MEKLKPCPKKRCRGPSIYLIIPGWGHVVVCESCEIFVYAGNKFSALKKWNRRHTKFRALEEKGE